MAVDLDNPLTGHHFLDKAVDSSERALTISEILPGNTAKTSCNPHSKHRHQHGDQSKRQGQDHHGNECRNQRDQRLEEVRDSVSDNLTQGVDIICIDRHDIPVGMGVEIAQRKVFHMGEQSLT